MPPAARTLQADVRAQSHDQPFIAAARVLLAKLHAVANNQICHMVLSPVLLAFAYDPHYNVPTFAEQQTVLQS